MIVESKTTSAAGVRGPVPAYRHAGALAFISILAILIYWPSLRSYYCGYDDFNEAYRAGFEDLRNPAQMFTTSHFHTSKYRPLNRALTAFTYYAGNGSAVAFRIRNLSFHIVAAGALYGIAFLLMNSIAGALIAATLFLLHPMANQSVVGSTWTNTTAYALMFSSFFLFMRAVSRTRPNWGALAAALVLGGLALFTYEATLVLFVLMAIFVIARGLFSDAPRPSPRFLVIGMLGILVIAGSFFVARTVFGEGSTGLSSAPVMFANLGLYAFALFIPVDPLLANSLFGFPASLRTAFRIWHH